MEFMGGMEVDGGPIIGPGMKLPCMDAMDPGGIVIGEPPLDMDDPGIIVWGTFPME